MKKIIQTALCFIVTLASVHAQAPASWTVNPNAYSNSMNVTCRLSERCTPLTTADNQVAAFVNGQCRGVANTATRVDGRWLAFLTIYSNTVGETVTLRVYNAETGQVFEALNTFTFSTDGLGGVSEPLLVLDNHPPTDIRLSGYAFREDVTAGTPLATLGAADEDANEVFTYSLPAGELDNARYTINGDQLVAAGPYTHGDTEDQVRITVTDDGGCSYTKAVSLTIIAVDQKFAPADVTLIPFTLLDQDPAGTLAGILSTTDADQQTGHVYTPGSCSPNTGNDAFEIRHDSVFTKRTVFYHATPVFHLCIRTTDDDDLYFEKTFEIAVAEPMSPTDIIVDNLSVKEGNNPDLLVGTARTVDTDALPGEVTRYELTPGDGDDDNAQFYLADDRLYLAGTANYDVKPAYNFRLKATDIRGASFEKPFVLTVLDDPQISLPLPVVNYLSPNDDGKNDYWAVRNVDIYKDFSLRIVDQFGNVVYARDNNYQNEWDGKLNGRPLPDGNYYFIFGNGKKTFKGNIAIVNH